MNQDIIANFQNSISSNLEYLSNNSIRSSLEEYRLKFKLDSNDAFYRKSLEAIDMEEEEMDEQVQYVLEKFIRSTETEVIERFTLLSKFDLNREFVTKSELSSFNCILFEHVDESCIQGITLKLPSINPGKLIDDIKNLEYVHGSGPSFVLEEFFEPLFEEDFDYLAGSFDYKLEIFKKLKEIFYYRTALCLNKSLTIEPLNSFLTEIGFEKDGEVYLTENDIIFEKVHVNE